MTTAHVEKFAELVGKDLALLARLGLDKVNADAAAAAASAAALITNAVAEAKAQGLEFTEEEARAFIEAEIKATASGELSDTLLEAVAGGKGRLGGGLGFAALLAPIHQSTPSQVAKPAPRSGLDSKIRKGIDGYNVQWNYDTNKYQRV